MNFLNPCEIPHILSPILRNLVNYPEKIPNNQNWQYHTYLPANFCNYMWVFKVKNVKLQGTTKSFIVALFYKTNPTQNTTNITEITKSSLNLVPHTYFKVGEKFPLIVYLTIQCNLTLLIFLSYCHTFLTSTGVQSEQIFAHNLSIVVKQNAVSVTNM